MGELEIIVINKIIFWMKKYYRFLFTVVKKVAQNRFTRTLRVEFNECFTTFAKLPN